MRRGGRSQVSRPRLVRAFAAPAVTGSLAATLPPVAGSESGTVTSGAPTLLFSEGFESGSLAGNGWFDDDTVPIVTDNRPGSAGTKAVAWAWANGASNPTGVAACRRDFTPSDSVYLSYWVKFSTNWVGSGQPDHPHMFHLLTDADDHYSSLSRTHLTTYDELIYLSGGMVYRKTLQDALNIDTGNLGVDLTGVTENRAVCGGNGVPESGLVSDYYQSGGLWFNEKRLDTSSNVITDATKNQWHRIESYWQMNTIVGGIGQPNGVWQVWVDGVLVTNRSNIYFRTGARPTQKFRTFVMAPFMGNGSPVAQSAWVDDLEVWTARPAQTGDYTNEPAGLSTPPTITAAQPNSFDTLPNYWPTTAMDSHGWWLSNVGLSNWSIVSDSERGNCLQLNFPAGSAGGYSPGNAVAYFVGNPYGGLQAYGTYTKLFIGYYVKLSSTWSDANNGTKLVEIYGTPTDGFFYLNSSDRSPAYLHPGVGLANASSSSYNAPNIDNSGWSRGVWHKVEWYFELNTAGVANGVVKTWVDGTLVTDRADLYLIHTSRNLNTFRMEMTYGGGTSPVPTDMNVRFDDWYVKVGA